MDKLNFLKKMNVPVLVLDLNGNLICHNDSFSILFGEKLLQKKIKKFKNSFSILSCILDTENITSYNPIDISLNSAEPVGIMATYQKTNDEFLTLYISSLKTDKYIIFEFCDYSANYMLAQVEKKYEKLKSDLQILEHENEQYLSTKDKAQEQAIKMALLNRIFEALRQSIDINVTLKSAFKEISDIFGFTKVSFAFYDNNDFEIKNIYPQKYENEIGTKVNIDEASLKLLNNNRFSISNIAPKTTAQNVASKSECRILLPIYHTNKLLGAIVAFFPRKNLNKINIDMMNAVSAQFTGAIVQSYLFQELNLKNEQLVSAIKELEDTQLQLINTEKMASLGQLVAGVAHEINTPLASINSNNDLYEKIFEKGSLTENRIETIKSMLETDKEAIKRITNIVKSLKRFVRLDEAELQKANINKELDLTLELLKHETKNRIEIVKNYAEVDEITCYPNLLNQVFTNILMNAVQSIEGAGKIFITTLTDNGKLFVSIKDTGSGMDDKTKDKIFKTGFTTKKIGIGTGLGLMISKKIIEKHSGEIKFNSKKGQGTEFIITIPALE